MPLRAMTIATLRQHHSSTPNDVVKNVTTIIEKMRGVRQRNTNTITDRQLSRIPIVRVTRHTGISTSKWRRHPRYATPEGRHAIEMLRWPY